MLCFKNLERINKVPVLGPILAEDRVHVHPVHLQVLGLVEVGQLCLRRRHAPTIRVVFEARDINFSLPCFGRIRIQMNVQIQNLFKIELFNII